jgi:hypothetical protein
VLDAALRAIGVDSTQWRALVVTGLRVDLRTTGAMSLSRRGATSGAQALRGFVLSLLAMGAFITIVLFVVADIFFALSIFFSFVIFSIGSSLLIDFHSIVLSPDDQRQLGYQPIDSRTFFAARVTSVLLYVAMMTVSLGIFPVIGCLFRPPGNGSDGGLVVALAVIAALVVAALLTTFAAIGMYVALLHYVPTARLKSALTYVQLAATFLVYSSYFFLPRLLGSDVLREQILPRHGWILANPGTWFAGYVDLALGRATTTQAALVTATVALCAISMRLVAGRLSLDYADRLSLVMSETAAEADAASARARLPGGRLFRDGERRAIALLVRGLFRHDMKFRLGVLSVLPLTLVYLFGGIGPQGVTDPFVSPGEGGQLIYFAVLFFPSMMRQALSRSDAFRAAWILYATPADSARLVLAIKDLVLVRFVLPYLLFVAVLIVYWFERIDHLAVLMLTLALLVHLIVVIQLWLNPELPFSQPSAKGARTRDTIVLIVIISSLAPQLPWLLHVLFATPVRLAATLAALVLVNVALLQVTTRRVRRLANAAEFPM